MKGLYLKGNLIHATDPITPDQPAPLPALSSRLFPKVIGLIVWAVTVYGTSTIHQIESLNCTSICGPWGCGPTLSALLGYHLFSFVLIAPPLVGICSILPPKVGSRLANALFFGGLIGAVGLFAWSSFDWYLEGSQTEYSIRRGLFSLVTATDIPLIQVTISGLISMFLMNWRVKSTRTDRFESSTTSDPLNETAEQATI